MHKPRAPVQDDKLAKCMSFSGLPTNLLTIGHTGVSQLPANFVDRPGGFRIITRVLAMDTFYDPVDKETYGIVLAQTESGPKEGEWTFFSHVLAPRCAAGNLIVRGIPALL